VSSPRPDHRRGVAATEFAVCLPVLMLLLLGSIECCSMIFLKQALSVAAYEAGHTAVLPDANAAAARRSGEEVLTDRNVRGATVQLIPADLGAVAVGDYFEVRASAPTDDNRILPLSFFGGRRLAASAFFMREF